MPYEPHGLSGRPRRVAHEPGGNEPARRVGSPADAHVRFISRYYPPAESLAGSVVLFIADDVAPVRCPPGPGLAFQGVLSRAWRVELAGGGVYPCGWGYPRPW